MTQKSLQPQVSQLSPWLSPVVDILVSGSSRALVVPRSTICPHIVDILWIRSNSAALTSIPLWTIDHPSVDAGVHLSASSTPVHRDGSLVHRSTGAGHAFRTGETTVVHRVHITYDDYYLSLGVRS